MSSSLGNSAAVNGAESFALCADVEQADRLDALPGVGLLVAVDERLHLGGQVADGGLLRA